LIILISTYLINIDTSKEAGETNICQRDNLQYIS